jgi:N-methylhydantoinase A/oxoprolinase/acetone carboxylase beta subunit/N-methylhydantoinase B/oxoprolinase/acetone carboxylase alpha subunit
MSIRIGIDTGGTFTDLVAFDDESNNLIFAKRPSTPQKPEQAVIDVLNCSHLDSKDLSYLVLGTTIGTNALLERKGARVLYLTTEGFPDIPFIQRADKKDPYDLQWQKPKPFVSREDCIGVEERITSDGIVLTKLTDDQLKKAKNQISDRMLEKDADLAIAINLLFSYTNSSHEQMLLDYLHNNFPDLAISLSSEVAPIWREYERASTTIIDAYLKPLTSRFLENLESILKTFNIEGELALMRSNGGQILVSVAKEQPVHTLLSGLSGGVIGGKYFGEQTNRKNIITFDMGGTSTDVATIIDGKIKHTSEYEIDFNIPVSIPVLELNTIGAGGGSIAWIDKGGLMRVGPQSAGADPGPICYDKGGQDVTVTDANLVLGRLNPENFLGGEINLNLKKAREKIEDLGKELGLSIEETALSIIEIANENMANAIRVLTVERGIDPREFSLVAFGGAGPLHASEVAAALGINEVIVPPHPGLVSAFGAMVADLRVDKKWTHYYRSDSVDLNEINQNLGEYERAAVEELKKSGFSGSPLIQRTISMRYSGQNYEREIALPPGDIDSNIYMALLNAFHEEYSLFYGYCFKDEVIEFIHFGISAIGDTIKPKIPKLQRGSSIEPITTRQVYFKDYGYQVCPIFNRNDLLADCVIEGPAVVEEMDSTSLIYPNQKLTLTHQGTFIIKRRQKKGKFTAQEKMQGKAIKDSVLLAIINNSLVNITREMGTVMMHTAYSPIFSESKDFSCALFNQKGEMIAQGEYCPAQLGAIPLTVKWTVSEVGSEGFNEGDVMIHNDPYRGGCHMPEHMMLKPIFYKGKLVAFAAVIGHLAEIGAMAVGSFASEATEVFQEGLRVPPVKIMDHGEHVRDIWKILLANHRTPRNTWGDLHAMLAALRVAELRLIGLINKYDFDFFLNATEELISYSERLMREEIGTIPNGEYYSEERMEDDGITDQPFIIRTTVVINNGEVLVDFTGSDPQAKGPINATFGVTSSATYNAILQVTGAHIPRNAGCYRPIMIIAPPGSIVNVQYPGPSVGGNTETQPRIVGSILGALGHILPKKIMAAEGATSCNFLFGGNHPRTNNFYAHYHFEASGWGGRYSSDGNSAQNHIHGNCRVTPIEIFETLFPFQVNSYELDQDSGGPGKYRGGLGTKRVLRVMAPEITVSTMMDHVKEGAWGSFGGLSGGLAGIWIKKKGTDKYLTFSEAFGKVSPSKFSNVVIHNGDMIRIDSAGGGGYGLPGEREPELVLIDVKQGYVSLKAAEEHYKVKVIKKGENYCLDKQETTKLRAKWRHR